MSFRTDPLPPSLGRSEVPASCRQADTATLILRGGSGERQAIEALIGRYQGRVARFVIAEIGDSCHYEDLCQIIFVKMVLALPRLRSAERFEPWLFQIARNVCRDHLRARRGWRRLFLPYEPAHEMIAAPDPPPAPLRDEAVERGIEKLPAGQRNLLLLSLDGKKSYEELARLSNESVSAVRSRLYRARENLRGKVLAGDPE